MRIQSQGCILEEAIHALSVILEAVELRCWLLKCGIHGFGPRSITVLGALPNGRYFRTICPIIWRKDGLELRDLLVNTIWHRKTKVNHS